MALIGTGTTSGGGGGGGISSLTATVTTDPVTFIIEHVFDLGGVAAVAVTFTLLVLTPDGETFGIDPGTIQVITENAVSVDGVTFSGLGTNIIPYPLAADLFEVGGHETAVGASPRYLKTHMSIVDSSSFNTYAGPNVPAAQIRVDVEYR